MKKILFIGTLTLCLAVLPQFSSAQGVGNLTASQIQTIVASLQAQLNILVAQLKQLQLRQDLPANIPSCTPAGEVVSIGMPPCCRGLQGVPTSLNHALYRCLTITTAKSSGEATTTSSTPSLKSSLKVTVLNGDIQCFRAPCEFPLSNATVALYDMATGKLIGSQLTTVGYAQFSNLAVGTYRVVASNSTKGSTEGKIGLLTGQTAELKLTLSKPLTSSQIAPVVAAVGTIVVSPSIQVLTPNGQESLALDAPYRIRWLTTGKVGMVKIEWIEVGTGRVGTIDISEATRGYYDWTPTAAAGLTTGRSYVISISSYTNANIKDTSDSAFNVGNSVTAIPRITITAPIPGEAWVKGNIKKITWTSSNLTANTPLNIRLINATSSQITDILRRIPNNGVVTWVVGRTIDGGLLSPGKYRVRVCVAGLLGNCDKADQDGYLEIISPPKTSTLGASVVQSLQALWEYITNF